MKKSLYCIASCFNFCFMTSVNASPSLEDLSILNVESIGSACRTVSATVEVIDTETLAFEMQSLSATSVSSTPPQHSRKNCMILTDFSYPDNWQYSLVSVDMEGKIDLNKTAKAVHKISHHYQGHSTDTIAEISFEGPMADEYSETSPFEPQTWSPCGRKRHLVSNFQTRVKNSEENPSTIDTKEINIIKIQWREC